MPYPSAPWTCPDLTGVTVSATDAVSFLAFAAAGFFVGRVVGQVLFLLSFWAWDALQEWRLRAWYRRRRHGV
jgi:hypothetical protein